MSSSTLFVCFAAAVTMGCSGAADDGTGVDPENDSGATTETSSTDDDSGTDTATVADDTGSGPTDGPTSDAGSGVPDGDAPTDTGPVTGATVPNLKVAFLGDQGANSNTAAVLKQVKAEGAQFLIILGDFDYRDDPNLWDSTLTANLGADFPVFAAAGNHDVPKWPDYKTKLEGRLAKITGAKCSGEYGVKASCNYLGLFFVLSGVGTIGTGHEAYIKDALTTDKSIWRVCAWHKNQHDMQIGGKSDEVGWTAYQTCQNNGALIMTGHEHSYSRTKTLNALGDRAKGHGAFGEFAKLVVKQGAPGNTFVTVSGLGGVDIRDHETSHDGDTWWASWYASNGHLKNGMKLTTASGSGVGYGATYVTFNVDGNPKKARGYMKNLKGVEIDNFEITRE
jgi:hypothetical protein